MRPISDWLALRPAFFSLTFKSNTVNSKQDAKNTLNTDAVDFLFRFNRSPLKKPLLVSSLVVAGLSLQGFGEATQLDQVVEGHKLRVVSVAGDTTHFNQDHFLHGFGYEMSREFARDLNVDFEFKQVANVNAALEAVKTGKADIALTTASPVVLQVKKIKAVDLSCGNPATLTSQGLNPEVTWSFRDGMDPRVSSAHGFVCEQRQVGST